MKDVPINYLAVVVAIVWNMALGMLWYGPVFGKMWKSLMGFTDESMKAMSMTPMKAMVGGVITAFLMSFVLTHDLVFASAYYGMGGVRAGMAGGFWNWLGFIVPVCAGAVLWEGKTWKLFFLNIGYWLVALMGMGVILSVWK